MRFGAAGRRNQGDVVVRRIDRDRRTILLRRRRDIPKQVESLTNYHGVVPLRERTRSRHAVFSPFSSARQPDALIRWNLCTCDARAWRTLRRNAAKAELTGRIRFYV